MKQRTAFWIVLVSLQLSVAATLAEDAAQKPNFLLIVADDLCWRDLGFTGNPDVQTPNIDQLARDGVYLRQMYTPATTCSPSRHALYTGLFCVRAGAYPNHTRAYEGTRSIFTYLLDAGYRVALQGKQHVGPPETFPYEHLGAKNTDDFQATREFLTRHASQPWLLVFASNDPHEPWTRGPRQLYDAEKITVPVYLHDNQVTRERLAGYYAEISQLDQQVGTLLQLLRDTHQEQNTLIMFLSEQGSSFPYGGKWSVYDNGIRVATVARWPGRIQPGTTSDALMQYVDVVPTLLDAAGLNPDEVDSGCPDAAGNRGLDGYTFLDVLKGKSGQHRDYVFAQHTTVGINGYKEPYPMRAVRDARYKLILNLLPDNEYSIRGIHEGEPIVSWQEDARTDQELARRVMWLSHRPAEELYDLEADPYELHNLADDRDYLEIKERLNQQLHGWMRQQGDEGVETELKARSRQGAGRRQRGGSAEQR
jgi:N-sulfoglucosamine sulfohydrolase